MNATWSVEATDFIRENAGRLKDADLAASLTARFGRHFTVAAVRQKRRSLGLRKKPGRGVCRLADYRLPKAALPLCV